MDASPGCLLTNNREAIGERGCDVDRLEVEGKVPTLVLNVTHPLVPDQIVDFCKAKRAVLIDAQEP